MQKALDEALELSIIIPTKNRPIILAETLKRVLDATKNVNAEIILINDSNNKIKLNEHSDIKIFQNLKSGAASARNYGAKNSKASYLLFLDDDMWISESNINTYLKFKEEYKNSTLNLNWEYPEYLKTRLNNTFLGRYLNTKNFVTLKGWNKGNIWNDNNLFESSGITSQNLFISKSDFKSLNGYNETFPHAGYEDFEFNKRIQDHGIKTYINPKSMMYHNEVHKMKLEGWLERNYRNAITQKYAVTLGHTEVSYNNSLIKKFLYKLLNPFRKLLIFIANILSSISYFYTLYFRIADTLTGLYIYRGYRKG